MEALARDINKKIVEMMGREKVSLNYAMIQYRTELALIHGVSEAFIMKAATQSNN